ncbi:type II toxin-antitoxin system HipA family toxin [Allopusillimonas ginsengisoli]|uniref:type II toxin-antitoxin system HipA family toxin n=1 Tax=Allopusillimonas ginsengisoli TaxID=453575 RepID=UPI00142F765B|nr:type II toxin-antitoxin system HipA family toxin [Allopusillimonas ginsengisoli]
MANDTEQTQPAISDLLDVWVDDHLGLRKVGVLERFRENGRAYQAKVAFHYLDGLNDADAVSLIMPIRRASYEPKVAGMVGNLPPVFDQNIPEGALRAYLVNRYLKVITDMGDFELLHLAGNRTIGRIRVVPHGQSPDGKRPVVPSLKEVLATTDSQQLLEELFEKMAHHSGVSGVQPKVLFSDKQSDETLDQQNISGRHRLTLQQDGYILKAAGRDFPSLAINEYLCLYASKMSGLATAHAELSDDGQVLAIKRFDLDEQTGHPIGFEDMASLSALTAHDKYKGSYEEMVKTMAAMLAPQERRALMVEVFKSIALSCAVGNGDAHLKNFGLLYEDPTITPRLAPVYDVCCTRAYLDSDQLALTLGGSKRFPKRDALVKFGRITCKMTGKEVHRVLEDIATGIEVAALELHYFCEHYPEFNLACGERMLKAWDIGMRYTLGMGPDYVLPASLEYVGTSRPKMAG